MRRKRIKNIVAKSTGPVQYTDCISAEWLDPTPINVCNGYRRRKWTRQYEFKSWTRLTAFHIALIPLGNV